MLAVSALLPRFRTTATLPPYRTSAHASQTGSEGSSRQAVQTVTVRNNLTDYQEI